MPTHNLHTSPALLKAIEDARTRTPSADEIRQQRISFVYGSLSATSSVTRAQVQDALERHEGMAAA